MPVMNNYNEKDYPNLYNEILEDFNFRYGKFNPIPYPKIIELSTQLEEETNNDAI